MNYPEQHCRDWYSRNDLEAVLRERFIIEWTPEGKGPHDSDPYTKLLDMIKTIQYTSVAHGMIEVHQNIKKALGIG